MNQSKSIGLLSIPVLVAALGYFVDIYDLLLFGMVRNTSLLSLGLTGDKAINTGLEIMSVQMYGLLIGGIFWGILGNKKGRLSVLFGSILLYSAANIANGFVHTIQQYQLCRFIAGIGLAGELGAGITLVSELISKEKRGIATSLVAGIGLTGAVAAYFISQLFDWRVCFYIGGGLGLALLALRVSVFESGMYTQVQKSNVRKGDFFMFFTKKKRAKKYILSVLIGLPTWYVIGLLIQVSDKFGKEFNLSEAVIPGRAVMYAYVAISIADVLIGLVSHVLKSRKKALYIFYAITIASIVLYFRQQNGTAGNMYMICALMGFGTGFWALFVTMAAEHFGTNLRATAATTVPNMVRGSLPIMVFLFTALQKRWGFSFIDAGAITGVIVMTISTIAVFMTEETFGKDLDFTES
ncbi:MFS transporter [Flavipsychrobacter stenotrophus]|uniref:MFS transporter n=1 Tax=Flavipsychrobacter stenotrophus TaxID=2077091 RepID=A0A2S7T0N0_9BACT|nr:MFS transporter [Flavipsychrobacter stenotrophus]PQJ12417.1 MFS transporter [Flavipsychrobacter stenotrophus]